MALPGAAAIAIMELRARTLVAAAAVLMLSCIALGLAGVSVFDRLFTRVDSEWLGMLIQLSPHLFPTEWTAKDFGLLAMAGTTLVIAADLVTGLFVDRGGCGAACFRSARRSFPQSSCHSDTKLALYLANGRHCAFRLCALCRNNCGTVNRRAGKGRAAQPLHC
jgi:hypothetical protein